MLRKSFIPKQSILEGQVVYIAIKSTYVSAVLFSSSSNIILEKLLTNMYSYNM